MNAFVALVTNQLVRQTEENDAGTITIIKSQSIYEKINKICAISLSTWKPIWMEDKQ